VLRQYHAVAGEQILAHEGTLEHFTGDGVMVFFNDPVQVPDAAERAVRMSIAIRERVGSIAEAWRRRGYSLGLGIGIAQGFATIGAIGFDGRWDYGAIGTVTNLAARLCGEAAGNEILISRRVYAQLEPMLDVDPPQALSLKGFQRPVDCFSVRGIKASPA